MIQGIFRSLVLCLTVWLAGCQAPVAPDKPVSPAVPRDQVQKLLVVDCLLPGEVRKLGGQLTYLTPRRPVRTTAVDCEIRGGEYTAYDRADYRTALQVWLAAAKEGNAEAQTHVGEIFERGLGTQPDYGLARQWYEKAAVQDFTRAQINLGHLYEKGLGVPADMPRALNWYRRASGLEGDDLQFASMIEVAVAESTQEQLRALQRQVEDSQRESASLSAQLQESTRALAHRQRQLQSALQRLQQLQKQASVYILKEQKNSGELAALQQQIDRLRGEIRQQQSTIDNLQEDVGRQKLALQERRILASAQVSADLTRIPGPSISILEPPLVLTRGLPTVQLPVYREQYKVLGRVLAPAGLAAFDLNGEPQGLDAQGLFRASIPVQGQRTVVQLKAIDRGGRTARLDFAIESHTPEVRSAAAPDGSTGAVDQIDFGNYHALVIGNNRYRHYPELQTAEFDAQRAEQILRERYGFHTRLLLNADRYTILSALNELRATLKANDNLLVYYAGHGEMDAENQRGYWLPVDAEQNNTANWISNLDLSEMLNVIPAKHVLVVADSCYSGTMTSSAQTRMGVAVGESRQRANWIRIMARTRARIVLTSGGVKPVLDSGGGRHSVFARAFLDALESNDRVVEGYSLYRDIVQKVQDSAARYRVEQVPRYAPIRHGGGLGEFFFVPRSGPSPERGPGQAS